MKKTTIPFAQRYLFISIVAGSIASGSPTYAQETSSSFSLEEILVTARKKEESVNDIPVAVTALSGDQLENFQAFDPKDLANYVPGMTVTGNQAPVYAIRGVGFNSSVVFGSSTVGVSHDQATLPFPAMTIGMMMDVERVEVLKGPQGTLYGRNTTAGQINYIVNKPTDEFEASILAESGNYDTWGYEAIISGPITDNLRARLATKTQQSDEGWQKSINTDRTNGRESRHSHRMILDWTPTDDLQVLLTASYWEDRSEVTAGQAIRFNPESINPAWPAEYQRATDLTLQSIKAPNRWGPDEAEWTLSSEPRRFLYDGTTNNVNFRAGKQRQLNQSMVDLKVNWDLDDNKTLTSQTYWVDYQADNGSLGGVTLSEGAGGGGGSAMRTLTQEFKLAGSAFEDRMSYQVGVMYAKDDLEERRSVVIEDTAILYDLRLRAPLYGEWQQQLYDLNQSTPGGTPIFIDTTGLTDFDLFSANLSNAYNLPGLNAIRATDPDLAAAIIGPRPSDQDIANARRGIRTWQPRGDVDTDTFAVFAHMEFDFNEFWAIEAGIRYTDIQSDGITCASDINGDGNVHTAWNMIFFSPASPYSAFTGSLPFGAVNAPQPGGCYQILAEEYEAYQNLSVAQTGFERELDEDNISARIAIDYKPNADMLYYFSIAKGYKAGVFSHASANTSTQLEPVDEESVLAYETGIKWSVSDTLQLNASGYFYDYEDKQLNGTVPDLVFNTLTRLVNVPESEVYGVEGEAIWAPTSNWYTALRFNYLHTEITNYVGFDSATGEEKDFAGSEFSRSPEWQGTFMVSYNEDIGNNWNIRYNVDASYTDDQHSDFGENKIFGIDSHIIYGASINLTSHDGLWQVNLWGKNLFNEYYWGSVGSALDTTNRGSIGKPLTWGLSVRRNF